MSKDHGFGRAFFVGQRDERGWVTAVLVTDASVAGGMRALPMAKRSDGEPASDGFEWGYSGQGPHALAESMLAYVLGIHGTPRPGAFRRPGDGPRSTADALYGFGVRPGRFCGEVVAALPHRQGFELDVAVVAHWIAKNAPSAFAAARAAGLVPAVAL